MRFYTEEDTIAFDNVRFLFIQISLDGHVLTITLNRPEKRNAFTPTMVSEIAFGLAYAQYNSQIRCIVINATGPVFCAGADLSAFHDQSADQPNTTLPASREEIRLGDVFRDLHKPCIAKVEGPVFAGGFLLICGCTFVYSVPEASFSLPEVKRGIWPMQVMESLRDIVPSRKILAMAITGESYTASEAFDLGLVTTISDKENITADVSRLASKICEAAPLAVQSGIRAFQQLKQIPVSQRHDFLKSKLDILLASEDAKEGLAAFKEKRNPVWKGK